MKLTNVKATLNDREVKVTHQKKENKNIFRFQLPTLDGELVITYEVEN